MCGILGWLGDQVAENQARFDAALDQLSHRGPDDRGIWHSQGVLLGHRRLSVIDLSAGGHQPMCDPETGAILVFNGEIYNYIELAEELSTLGHRFTSRSDTEVLLHALRQWGVSAIPRLNGMWAFAFWSPIKKQLLLSRDRFGVKPLYYRSGPQGFVFASEPKSILSLFPEHRVVDEDSLLDFLGNNLLYARNTSFYKGVSVFPSAHYGIFDVDSGKLTLSQYWDYPDDVNNGLTEEEARSQFARLFEDSVRLRMRTDVPLGITLSGGLDSTGVLTAALKTSNLDVTCLTSVYSGTQRGELYWAELATKAAEVTLTPVIAPTDEWLSTLRKIVWHMDAPGYSPAVYPLWKLMQRARADGIPVLLEGQGADEALAGYAQYAAMDFLGLIKCKKKFPRKLVLILDRFLKICRAFGCLWTIAWVARDFSPKLLALYRRQSSFQSVMLADVDIPLPPISKLGGVDLVRNQLQNDHARLILPGLLQYGDAISMAHGIETRNPFLDYRLVEWMFRLPSHLRFHNGQAKWVLREYLRHNSQQKIGNRPDKMGYPTPLKKWLEDDGESNIEQLLLHNGSPILQWCDREKVRSLIQKSRIGVIGADYHLYKLISTQLWLQECIH